MTEKSTHFPQPQSQSQPTSLIDRSRIGVLAVRVDDSNSDHHLWNNNGTWWCHFTLHRPDTTVQRIRASLRTKCVLQARARRDRIFADLNSREDAGPVHRPEPRVGRSANFANPLPPEAVIHSNPLIP